MSNENIPPIPAPMDPKKVTRDDVIAAIKYVAAELGRQPSLNEVRRRIPVTQRMVHRWFGSYSVALAEAGLDPQGPGHKMSMEKIFARWAGAVKKLKKIPTIADYERHVNRSGHAMITKFGSWSLVPMAMLEYAEENGLQDGWEDVLELTRAHIQRVREKALHSNTPSLPGLKTKIRYDRPVYGDCFIQSAMAFAPRNEMGVLSLFSAMAEKLGFVIIYAGSEFPDCEAFRQVAPGQWQRVTIELEFQSRNFVAHQHDPQGCDMIVCWEHNWNDCPLEVLELESAVRALREAEREGSPRRRGEDPQNL